MLGCYSDIELFKSFPVIALLINCFELDQLLFFVIAPYVQFITISTGTLHAQFLALIGTDSQSIYNA